MLVDDPVKRVDNMTMAHGLEARTPFLDHELVELAAACPPELKLAEGGKGILKAAARGVVPDEVIDRPEGLLPGARALPPRGRRARARARGAHPSGRGLVRPAYVDRLLADPNGERTTLDGSKLWQVALLELWLRPPTWTWRCAFARRRRECRQP